MKVRTGPSGSESATGGGGTRSSRVRGPRFRSGTPVRPYVAMTPTLYSVGQKPPGENGSDSVPPGSVETQDEAADGFPLYGLLSSTKEVGRRHTRRHPHPSVLIGDVTSDGVGAR